jgi:type III secretion system HrpE/YscL family protein
VLRAPDLVAWSDGAGIRDAAAAQAVALIDRARTDAAAIRAAAHEEGRARGAAEATQLLAETEARIDAALAALEPRLAQTVLLLLGRVLDAFDRPELVARLAARAVVDQRAARGIVVRVPPGTQAAVEAHLGRLADGRLARVQADPTLAPTDCVVETELGTTRAGVAAQLAALERALQAARP